MDEVTTEIDFNSKNVKPADRDPSRDLVKENQKQVDELVEISRKNFNKIMERDQKLSDLTEISKSLEEGAGEFKTQADYIKRKEWRKHMKTKLVIAGLLLVLFVIITLLVIYA